jgi:hypothetical protein
MICQNNGSTVSISDHTSVMGTPATRSDPEIIRVIMATKVEKVSCIIECSECSKGRLIVR